MRLVVGLGNPGERYRRTRHNVGFMVVDALAARAGVRRWAARRPTPGWPRPGWAARTCCSSSPLTFMNRSGVAVERVLAARGGAAEDLVVVLDDVALELGTLRVRERGSHGGHNGLRSLIEMLGTDEFPRVRVGIRKGEPPGDLADYVLSEFPEEDVLVVQEVVGLAGGRGGVPLPRRRRRRP